VEKKGYETQKGTFAIEEEVVELDMELVPEGAGPKPPKKSKKWLFIGIGIAALLIIAAVVVFLLLSGSGTKTPQILSFTAEPTGILLGKPSTLTWETADAVQLLLNEEEVEPTGSKKVTPGETTTYTLVAKGEDETEATETCSVEVTIPKRPEILTFTANPGKVDPGGSSVLKWKTSNADKIYLESERVEAAGEKEVFPEATTTYRLTVEGEGGKEMETVNVNVRALMAPEILTFEISPAAVRKGQSAVLKWNTKNAESITLEGVGDLAASGQKNVQPDKTTTYTIVAKSKDGEARQNVKVSVQTVRPGIRSFTASASIIKKGGSVTIRWSVSDAEEVLFYPGGKRVKTSGSLNLRPTTTTAYTLLARSSGGTVKKSVTVRVSQPPRRSVIYSRGRVTIRGTWSCDLDRGKETMTGADFFWEQATRTVRYLTPRNGAKFRVLGKRDFNTITESYLKRVRYSTAKIIASTTRNSLPRGTVVACLTNEGRYCKFLIESYGYNLTISWVTYDSLKIRDRRLKPLFMNMEVFRKTKKKK